MATIALITAHALAITKSERTTPRQRSISESASLKHSVHSDREYQGEIRVSEGEAHLQEFCDVSKMRMSSVCPDNN